MAEVFHLPAVGDTMVEGEIVEWFVAVGDEVQLDQVICSLETDKSVVEMSTPFRGTVLQLGGRAGDSVAVGAALIVVGEPGEEVPPEDGTGAPAPAPHVTTQPAVAAASSQTPITNGAVLAMPKVRKLAREQSADLSTINGTGPRGSITIADVQSMSKPGERRERLSAMRRSIAEHLTQSVQQVPQFTSMVEADASGLLATLSSLRAKNPNPVPIDALLTALLVPVLKDHPLMNAKIDGDDVVYFDQHHVGIAVDTPDGLMVPVVRSAGSLGVVEIAAEVVRLADAARNRTIQPAELFGPTCTVNNVGALGILAGTPILPLGTSAIIAFGRTRPVVKMRDGNPVEVPVMTISATFDHRLIDGGTSGRFLMQLKRHLEVPALGFL